MSTLPPCPKCNSEYTYEDGSQLICPECSMPDYRSKTSTHGRNMAGARACGAPGG